ncbi:winged helix-turn-helix transcriptional regulator [Nocardia fluminea]|uniref:winged helix-turn-helix transcriptional regulator n=1 Tax=Nocardia fluminea TaxID=134984 RepID=UPI0037AD63C3
MPRSPGIRRTSPTRQAQAAAVARRIFATLSAKWASTVIEAIGTGERRFAELHRTVDSLSYKMLTQNSAAVVARGLGSGRTRPDPNRGSRRGVLGRDLENRSSGSSPVASELVRGLVGKAATQRDLGGDRSFFTPTLRHMRR